MTYIAPKNTPTPRGNGRIRRALPTLGLIVTAIGGISSWSDRAQVLAAPEVLAPAITTKMIAEDATILHFARAQGIGDAIRETGVPFSDPLNVKLGTIREIVEAARTERTDHRIDMVYSSGYLDAVEGGWDPDRLDRYADAIFQTERGIFELADQATLRWSADLGLEGGRALVTGAIAMTVSYDPYEPIWTGTLEEGSSRGTAFLEVSGATRLLLDAIHDAAYVPDLAPGLTGPLADLPEPFRDTPPSGTCAMEI